MFEALLEPFMQDALLAGVLVAGSCAYIGVFMLYKRIVFIGITLAQLSAWGVVVGLSVGFAPSISGFCFAMAGIFYFSMIQEQGETPQESLVGLVYTVASALTVLFLARNPGIEAGGMDVVSGHLLFVSPADIVLLVEAVLLIAVIHLLFFKEFLFVTFDQETAATLGIKTGAYDLLLFFTFGVIISVSMKVAGVVFVFASLVIPALIAVALTNRTRLVFLSAVLIGGGSCVLGVICSYAGDLPTGPTVVALLGLFYIMVATVKKIRH